MLTNSSVNKLKASKSSRDLVNFVNESEGTHKIKILDKSGEGDRDNDDGGTISRNSLSTKAILSRERADSRLKPRIHLRDEFHMVQGSSMDRRSTNIRGRGGFSRKIDRENDSNSTSRGRFQESLSSKANFSDVSSYTSKYSNDAESKSRMDHAFNILPEDSRISKTIRRLSREDDLEKFLALCQQLQDSLTAVDNARYIRRAFDDIASSLRGILHRGPGAEAKARISQCLGRVGFVLIEQDFKRYAEWIFQQYAEERATDVKMLLLKAMIETLRLDSENPKLKEFSSMLTAQLQNALENTDLPELTMATVDVIISVTESYPAAFTKYFRDTVDILVGWHIDGSHSQNITYYASRSLLRLGQYWVADLPFSVTLLGQFLEDMEADEEDLVQLDSDKSSIDEPNHSLEACLVRITGLIKVFNTVAKCLGQNLNPTTSQIVSWSFLTDNLSKMLRTVTKALHISLHEDLIVTANECCCILLSLLQSRTSPAHEKLYELINIQLNFYTQLEDLTVISMLRNIAKIIREVSGNLPMELVQTLLRPASPILLLRFSPSITIQGEVLAVYHALLNLKNIPLLQEAYRNVLGDLERAYKVVLPSIKELVAEPNPHAETNYNAHSAEFVVMFHLKALTDLANATNSIIGMWALNPSILELLAVLLQPYDSCLSPHLQHSLLYLLHSHCSKSNNFVSTSDFVITGRDQASMCNTFGLPANLGPDARSVSPTSRHYSIILRLLAKLLLKETKEEILVLVLLWSREMFYHSESYINSVYGTEEFDSLISLVVNAGHSSSKVIISRVADNIEQLLSTRDAEWKPNLLASIIDVCLFHSNSTIPQVRHKISRVLPLVPWDIMIIHLNKTLQTVVAQKKVTSSTMSLETLNVVSRNHIARGSCGEMHQQQFKKFMGYLLQGIDNGSGNWLQEMFCQCWPLQSFSGAERKSVSLFGNLALMSNVVLLLWATWEAAQLCVRQKLRTPLGKAIDTFTYIEGAIRSLARELTQGIIEIKSDNRSAGTTKTFEQRRVRLLLEFFEHFEKAMHNAAEGCATAMQPPPIVIRGFFLTNKHVCTEWLKRIRMAVIVVAIRAGQATTAVRHGHCLLQALADANTAQGPEFEQAAMYTCWALCKLREPEAIQGLYAWCREVSGRRFYWLKASCQQAAGKYEVAAEEYRKLLEQPSPRHSPTHNTGVTTDENSAPSPAATRVLKGEPDPQIMGFMADQLAECYRSVQNWSDLHKWKLKEVDMWSNQNGGTPLKYLLNNMSANHVKALQEFEDKDFFAASELMKWPADDKPLKQITEATKSWSSYKAMSLVNTSLTTIALQLTAGRVELEEAATQWSQVLDNCFAMSQCYLQEGIRNPPSEFLHDAVVLQYATAGLQNIIRGNNTHNPFTMTNSMHIKDMNTSLLTQVLWWAQCFDRLITLDCPKVHTNFNQLCLEVVQTARKEGNYNLAQKLLLNYLEKEEGISISGKRKLSLEEVASNVLTFNICDEKLPAWNIERVKAFTEVAKLLFYTDKPEKAVEICVFTAMGISKHLSETDDVMRERSSRLLLTLSKWLQEKRQGSGDIDMGNLLVVKLINAEKARNNLVIFSVDDGPISVPPSDVAIGYLLQLAAARCPTLSKTWEQFATWCYRWGRRMVETDLATSQLSDVDKVAVQQLMPRGTTIEEFEKVTTILSQTRSVTREEDIEGEDINTSEMIKSQLQNVRTLAMASGQQLDALVGIWRNTQRRIYSYLQQAATAYFKYLHLCGDSGADDCKTIIATLRLLRLIVKHALELQEVLESGLGSTPVRPWKIIIPQLFSRLSHPEPYVRTRVSELLCRVAQDAPHLITFPAVVGAVAGGARLRDITRVSTSRLFSAGLSQPEDEEEEEEEEEEDDDEGSSEEVSVLQDCFLAMVDTLSKQAPVAISQVQLVVAELHRITLLWDELWLGTLVQHHAEISRRLSQLEGEINRVDDNPSLTPAEKDGLVAEKHRIILKPLVFMLEQLHAITSVPPETPHETWFQEKFNGYITDALQKLKCPTNPRKPQESWHPLKLLQSRLQQRASKRAAYAINMSDVSPALAALKDTVIAMPGVNPSPGKIITIAAVDNYITILPTKTKPKKLVFHGNDGRMYTYLFKGLEDLHLDERIMQFLSIANTMMSSERGGSTDTYRARHYSVIPLGPRSGLISWVDGVTPLFGLYKRWQQRDVAAGSLKAAQAASSHVQVMRPSEMFYSKLTPLLKEKGVTNLDNRKEWPLPILRQVLTELMDETPKDLLAKELWGHSINAGGWWRSTRTYSYSVAVMSIIGYIIGLGDRHLDNVLVDLSTGEVVHIDYNVCFEKGKTLRVPEKVPFRMTPNIRTALGVTGVEGIFRLTCEHVLKVMKKGRETLLTLLEAFVYDPLIDWTPGNEAGYTGAVYGRGQAVASETKQSRKELEHEVTRAMFCVRITEIKSEWLRNRDDVLEAIPELVVNLNQWLQIQNSVKIAEESLQDCHQQIALVKEAEAQGSSSNHPLYTLSVRYAKHRRAKDALDKVRITLAEKIEECDRQLTLHKAAVVHIRTAHLGQWLKELSYTGDKDNHLVFDLVKEFLHNAGQGQMVTQCEQSEIELGQLAHQQDMFIRTCLHLLSQYAEVSALYPASYLNTHRSVCFRRWALYLLNNMSLDSVEEVRAQLTALLSPHVAAQHILNASFQLQNALGDANVRLKKSFDRLANEGLPDNMMMLEASYMKARSAIASFPLAEKGAALALECVLVTALCVLNRKYLMMESAAYCAGDVLVDLTSRDGDWFLDEMYNVSNLVTELTSMIPTHHLNSIHSPTDTRVQLVLQCVQSSHSIYKGLQELNYNFHTIILPEAVKTIQTEEPTVLAMVQDLRQAIAVVGYPLDDLLAQLETHLRCIIMEMDSPHGDALQVVSVLRARYESLLKPRGGSGDGTDLSSGQMLLMGFNGLFDKLQQDGNALVSALDTLDTPSCWKKVDQVWDAKAVSAPVFNDATRGVLEDIFLIKRLQTMQEFFTLCEQMSRMSTVVYDDESLNKPIRRFIADYVSRRLLGVLSQTLALAMCLLLQRIGLNVTAYSCARNYPPVEVEQRDVGAECKVPLEELCRKAVDMCLKLGRFTGGVLAQASGLTSTLEATWRRRELARHLQQDLDTKRASLQRLQMKFTAFHWLHEDSLQGAAMTPISSLSRANFMMELRKTSTALITIQPRLSDSREQQNALVASVGQRLKWAAGANPALMEVLAAFESAVTAHAEQLAVEQRIAVDISNTCNALLQHEALRTRTSESTIHDNAFVQMLEQCEQCCLLATGYDQTITPTEESLVQLVAPNGSIDNAWIHNAEVLISDNVKLLQQRIIALHESLVGAQSGIKGQAGVVRSLMDTHNKLMADVKNLVKSMVKYEDNDLCGLQDYWNNYRAYSEQFAALTQDLTTEDLDLERIHIALDQLSHLVEKTGTIYEGLLVFALHQQVAKPGNGEDGGKLRRPPLLRQESICLSPRRGVPVTQPESKKAGRDPHTGKELQERNAYAVGVWRRVRTKLEGRDPDLGRKVTVQEQVDYVIREATSLDNLALLYEGWTPWV